MAKGALKRDTGGDKEKAEEEKEEEEEDGEDEQEDTGALVP